MSYMQLVITNLHLLQFKEVHGLTLTSFAVIADPKLADSIFYFLLSKLNPTKTHKVFRMPIPPEDFSQRREFRTHVYQWLEELKPHFFKPIMLRKSLLDEGRGERFQELLFALSTYTLYVVLKKNFPEVYLPELTELQSKSMTYLEDQLQLCQTEYLQCIQDHYAKQKGWVHYSQQLIQEHQALSNTLKDIHTHRHQKRRRSSNSFTSFQQQWIDTSIQFAHAWHTLAQHPWDQAHSLLHTCVSSSSTSTSTSTSSVLKECVLKGPHPNHPVDWTRLVQLAELSIQPLTDTTVDLFSLYLDHHIEHQSHTLNQLEKKLNQIEDELNTLPHLERPSDSNFETLGFPTLNLTPLNSIAFLDIGPYKSFSSSSSSSSSSSTGSVASTSSIIPPTLPSSLKPYTPNKKIKRQSWISSQPTSSLSIPLSKSPRSLRMPFSDDLSEYDLSEIETLDQVKFIPKSPIHPS